MPFKLVGLAQFEAALKESVVAADRGAKMATVRAAAAVETAAKKKLAASSHRKGTPTPSRPGEPPSLVTGTLRRGVRSTPARKVGPTAWETQVGPTAVYARVQELGGWTGWGHQSHLPARPYFEPAVRELVASGALWAAFRTGWERF